MVQASIPGLEGKVYVGTKGPGQDPRAGRERVGRHTFSTSFYFGGMRRALSIPTDLSNDDDSMQQNLDD